MPWKPRYSRDQATEAILASDSWADALRRLGISPRGKNFSTIRRWAAIWEIDASHLPPYRPKRPAPRFSEDEARAAIAAAYSWSEALRRLGYCPTGGNPRTLKKWALRWGISTSHFNSGAASTAGLRRRPKVALQEILVQGSTYSRGHLKDRLYEEGLKQPVCECCGQEEIWQGRRMSMILDHINGVRDDNRLENLRIVCPNCAATLDTHCGRKHPLRLRDRRCERCGATFQPKYRDHRYCSRVCGTRWDRRGTDRPGARRAARPPYEQLLEEIECLGYTGVGRKYGVSDSAVRKWVRFDENEIERRQSAE
jgi:hypothetical protein